MEMASFLNGQACNGVVAPAVAAATVPVVSSNGHQPQLSNNHVVVTPYPPIGIPTYHHHHHHQETVNSLSHTTQAPPTPPPPPLPPPTTTTTLNDAPASSPPALQLQAPIPIEQPC